MQSCNWESEAVSWNLTNQLITRLSELIFTYEKHVKNNRNRKTIQIKTFSNIYAELIASFTFEICEYAGYYSLKTVISFYFFLVNIF